MSGSEQTRTVLQTCPWVSPGLPQILALASPPCNERRSILGSTCWFHGGLDPLKAELQKQLFLPCCLYSTLASYLLFCNYCQEMFTANMLGFWQSAMWESDKCFLCVPLWDWSLAGWGSERWVLAVGMKNKAAVCREAAGSLLGRATQRPAARQLQSKGLANLLNASTCLQWVFMTKWF